MTILDCLSKSFPYLLVAHSPVCAGKKNKPYPVFNLNCHPIINGPHLAPRLMTANCHIVSVHIIPPLVTRRTS